MKHAVVIYPHQLFKESPALAIAKVGDWPVYLVEEPLILTHNPIHRQKLLLHKLSMDAYETYLKQSNFKVIRLGITEYSTTESVFAVLQKDGVEQMHIVDTTDNYLEQAIHASGIERVWYDSPLFLLTKEDAMKRFVVSKRFMASFYKQLRKDLNILIDTDSEPVGGKWSFDDENRNKIPKGITYPEDISFFNSDEINSAITWVENVPAEKYGECKSWIPYTQETAETFLQEFFRSRFVNFGPYEDAIHTEHARLWHSTLSPLINIGLLTPKQVIDATITYATEHEVPLNSLEGFIRQIIGWREFIRASYEVDGSAIRNQNFFNHTRALPESFWTGTTNITPIDHTIKTALTYGYTHHIERLMVMGNFMLLSMTNPHDVYKWFMSMYVDAYDWVMVPNIYGMSQFADGGTFATKPYISGANYLKKMSNYHSGDWEVLWTALYWHFIHTHEDFFKSNHRLSMMPRTLAKMNPETRHTHFDTARKYLAK